MSEQDTPEDEGVEPGRARVDVRIGALVQCADKVYRISQVLDFESVIGLDVESGRSRPLLIGDLRPLGVPGGEYVSLDLAEIADEDWRIAEQRFAVIQPLVDKYSIGRDLAEKRAKETGVNTATIYRWLKRYKAYGDVSALIPKKRGWKAGKGRIPIFAEEVIREVIEEFYLSPQRPTAQKAVTEVRRRCLARGIEPPSPSTIRARIARISEKEELRGRGYREKAKNRFMPTAGHFPNVEFPLAVVQIDHTPADIILVDDLYRKPIGRPWITLAMDLFSRMVVGYYLSFDPPSETSVAMCVAHAMLPKEEWLLLHHVEAEWPVWGIPKTIHVDNGADFRSNTFRQSCLAYGIHLEYRPVKQPRYGGHIERMLGTLLKEIHDLPGTTFSSIKEKDEYDAEKHAVMTKSEFEEWLVSLICNVYHKRIHHGIGMTPFRKWEIGIFGNAEVQGTGLPAKVADRQSALLDFLPAYRRTVQTFGVTIDGMPYFAEALRPWINTMDPDNPGKKREFIFRRDPRDISAIWFRDPAINQYFKIPFADQGLPPMSIWEYRQAREALRAEGLKSVNEHQVLHAITELRNKVAESEKKTKKARRQAQRTREHRRKISPAAPLKEREAPVVTEDPATGLLDGEIDAFGDIA